VRCAIKQSASPRKRLPAIALTLLLAATPLLAQPANTPDLDYIPVPDTFSLPAGMNFGPVSGVAINSKGNIFVLNRGPQPLMEFDANGKFVRSLGEALVGTKSLMALLLGAGHS
jgi:hypothetical protein